MAFSQPEADFLVAEAENKEVQLARELLDTLMSRTNAHLTYPFMHKVDAASLGLSDYYDVVKEPIWLHKMLERFANNEYHSIREFVCDFRLMLLNCYRYNGVESRLGRLAERLELLFEQKLQLMPLDIRNKTSIQCTLGSGTVEEELSDGALPRRRSSNRLFLSGDSRQLTPMRAISEELEHSLQSGGVTASLVGGPLDNAAPSSLSATSTVAIGAEDRAHILIQRLIHWRIRRQEEALISSWPKWFAEQNGPKLISSLHHTQELLEVYQFLWLTDPFLGISDSVSIASSMNNATMDRKPSSGRELGLYDLELALSVAPQASQLLAVCMSNLLATPKERSQIVAALSSQSDPTNRFNGGSEFGSGSIRNKPRQQHALTPLSYDVWERRLSDRINSWYRQLWDKGKGNVLWAARRLGLPTFFFTRCGLKKNPLESQRFHELTPYLRVQLLYALCETVLRNFENLRLSLDRDADWEAVQPVPLGSDVFSNMTYIHFPHMLDRDGATNCRVYRLQKLSSPTNDEIFKDACSAKPPVCLLDSENNNNSTPSPSSPSQLSEKPSESDEPLAVPTKTASRGRRRRRGGRVVLTRTKESSLGKRQQDELICHDQWLSETGLIVPGPVQRLPSWMPPCLSRSVCRRWFKIASQLEEEATSAMTQNKLSGLAGRGKKIFSTTPHGPASIWIDQLNFLEGRVKKPTPTTISNLVPFCTFQRSDNEKVKDLYKDDPALNPSPHATLQGLTQRYLSMRLARNCNGPVRGKQKSKHRKTNNSKSSSATASTKGGAEEDEMVKPSVSSITSQCDDDDVECDEEEDGRSSPSSSSGNENSSADEAQEREEAEASQMCLVANRVEEIKQDATDTVSCCEKHMVTSDTDDSNPVEQRDDKTAVLVKGEADEHTGDPANKSLSTADESQDILIEEPDEKAFALVSYDETSLQHLIDELNAIRSSAEEKMNDLMSHPTDEELCSDEDDLGDVRHFDDFLSLVDQKPDNPRKTECLKRYRQSLHQIQLLITNLERLRNPTQLTNPRRVDSQQLARLRLRHDVLAWEANVEEEQRMLEAKRISDLADCIEQQQHQQQLEQKDLAVERAERLRRRESQRFLDEEHGSRHPLSLEDDDNEDEKPSTTTESRGPLTPIRPAPVRTELPRPVYRVHTPPIAIVRPNVHGLPIRVSVIRSTTPGNHQPHPVLNHAYPVNPIRTSIHPHQPTIIRPPFRSPNPVTYHQHSAPLTRPPTAATHSRKIYRVHDTLFTEDAYPVRIDANGALHALPLESISMQHRHMARQIIARYKQHQNTPVAPLAPVSPTPPLSPPESTTNSLATSVMASNSTGPKRVAVTIGQPTPES